MNIKTESNSKFRSLLKTFCKFLENILLKIFLSITKFIILCIFLAFAAFLNFKIY